MGLITNFLAIIIGGILGLTIGKKFNEDIKNIIVDCAGIFIIVIGIKSALVAQKDIMILIYLITGAVIGQLINIDKRIKDFSQFIEDKFVKEKDSLNNEKSFAKGFSTATILYCVGAMAILGSINSGLTNDNTILNIKAILDGVISIVLTSIYGIGVIFSAISVTIYQGIFYLFAVK
jgi:possible transporter